MPEYEISKPLGGYIELQLPKRTPYYPALIQLNTARNCLEYILKVKGYDLIYVPYYTCEVLLEPIIKLGVKFEFYKIDANLDPVIDFTIGSSGCLLYTNYFGLKQNTVLSLSKKINNLIIDNAQAFFSEPLPGIDTFYSCRKFFGVADGAYLQINSSDRLNINNDVSFGRFSHLIKSIDLGIEQGYSDFVDNNTDLSENEIKGMSFLSQRILSSIDYRECKEKRNSNFICLDSALSSLNEFSYELKNINGPMSYPLLISEKGLKQKLIEKKVFIPTYWPNVFDWTSEGMYENYLAVHLLALPIDHRYDNDDMIRMVETIKSLL